LTPGTNHLFVPQWLYGRTRGLFTVDTHATGMMGQIHFRILVILFGGQDNGVIINVGDGPGLQYWLRSTITDAGACEPKLRSVFFGPSKRPQVAFGASK
jgi:hypothetical protein